MTPKRRSSWRYLSLMRRFAALYTELDTTTKTGVKVSVMARHFVPRRSGTRAWAVSLLCGGLLADG